MKSTPNISETEWEIMRIVWAKHPIASSEIFKRLAKKDSSWHPKTMRTLLARLVRKRALAYKARGRIYYYEPLVTQKECVTVESQSFLDRVFGGLLKPMLVHFAERRRLTTAELDELRRLLVAADQETGDGRKGKK